MITLSAEQCRVIGVMLEKETTTPEQYPLSLNGILIGCNQKSNREPVMCLTESDLQNTIDELVQMNLLMVDHKASSRVNKYFHRFGNTEFASLQLTVKQSAIIGVLLLRGPQTPGELRTRTTRLADFTDVGDIEKSLTELQALNGQTLVKKLPREPGKRDSRYLHLFSTHDENILAPVSEIQVDLSTPENTSQINQRVAELEQQVLALTKKMAYLTEKIQSE